MKFLKVALVFLFVIICFFTQAQQRPHYTQYILNNYIINPAVAGIENYWDAKLSRRQQWVGLQDAPTTTYLTIHGPLSTNDYGRETATSFHAKGKNPRGEAFWEDYEKPRPHLGLGGTFISDATGPVKRTSAAVALAYHTNITQKLKLAGGLQAGFIQTTLDVNKLRFGQTIDPVVAAGGDLNKIKPDISAGLWLYNADVFLGLAAQQIIPQKISFSNIATTDSTQGALVPHYFITAGTRLFLSEDFTVLPSMMLRVVSPLPTGFDANLKVQYQDKFWFGAGYRYQEGFSGMVGLNISTLVNIGYSYDVTTSRLNTVSNGSHEIVVGFLINNKYADWCPRSLW